MDWFSLAVVEVGEATPEVRKALEESAYQMLMAA